MITFNASESSSPDGEIAEYRWNFTDNGSFEKTSADPLANWTYTETGNNTVTLEVEDEGVSKKVREGVVKGDLVACYTRSGGLSRSSRR